MGEVSEGSVERVGLSQEDVAGIKERYVGEVLRHHPYWWRIGEKMVLESRKRERRFKMEVATKLFITASIVWMTYCLLRFIWKF